MKKYNIETLCVHNGQNITDDHAFGAISVPIYQSATFAHPGIGQTTGYYYTRESNPTRTELEEIVNTLEHAYDTVATSSGMAALSIVLELFGEGDHFVCSEDLYGGSVRIFDTIGVERGREFSYVDTIDLAVVEASIKENTKAIYIETPSNPTMQVSDLVAVSEIAKKHGALLIVDNTFLSPYFQNPIDLGADIVVHSGTKYLGGHNDTLSGFLSVNTKELAEKVRLLYKTIGMQLSPFDSYLMIRGIKTLAVRMERQQENAMKIAQWLKQNDRVEKVYYVGLPEHPGYEINKKQARGFGAMISFTLKDEKTARKILENVKVFSYAESLGGVESLITYPMLQTHGDVPVEIRERLGITETFLRMSVGIENVDDLIADLDQAFGERE